jgi:dTDP-4-dehydrorhamnose 3,5-epimerase
MEKENIIYYGCTNYRQKNHEIGILWNDKDLKINWPIKKPIISLKDKQNFSFKEYCQSF